MKSATLALVASLATLVTSSPQYDQQLVCTATNTVTITDIYRPVQIVTVTESYRPVQTVTVTSNYYPVQTVTVTSNYPPARTVTVTDTVTADQGGYSTKVIYSDGGLTTVTIPNTFAHTTSTPFTSTRPVYTNSTIPHRTGAGLSYSTGGIRTSGGYLASSSTYPTGTESSFLHPYQTGTGSQPSYTTYSLSSSSARIHSTVGIYSTGRYISSSSTAAVIHSTGGYVSSASPTGLIHPTGGYASSSSSSSSPTGGIHSTGGYVPSSFSSTPTSRISQTPSITYTTGSSTRPSYPSGTTGFANLPRVRGRVAAGV